MAIDCSVMSSIKALIVPDTYIAVSLQQNFHDSEIKSQQI